MPVKCLQSRFVSYCFAERLLRLLLKVAEGVIVNGEWALAAQKSWNVSVVRLRNRLSVEGFLNELANAALRRAAHLVLLCQMLKRSVLGRLTQVSGKVGRRDTTVAILRVKRTLIDVISVELAVSVQEVVVRGASLRFHESLLLTLIKFFLGRGYFHLAEAALL